MSFLAYWYFSGQESGKKKEHKDKLLGPEIAGWAGGLPREGVGVAKFVPSLASLFSLGFERAGILPGSRTPKVIKSLCNKVCAHFRPLKTKKFSGRMSHGHLGVIRADLQGQKPLLGSLRPRKHACQCGFP